MSKIVSFLSHLVLGFGWPEQHLRPSTQPPSVAGLGFRKAGWSQDSQSFYMVTGFSKTDRKRQKSEVAGVIGIKPRNWSSMTFAVLHRPHESQSLSGFTTSSLDPLLLTSHRATEKLFPLNYTVLDDNDNASILFSLLDLQRVSNWILFEPHKGRAGCTILI